jgi:hypothetical protein
MLSTFVYHETKHQHINTSNLLTYRIETTPAPLAKNRVFVTGIVSMGIVYACVAMHSSVLGMWTKSSVNHGGLDWSKSPRNVAIVLTSGLVGLLAFSLCGMAKSINHFGDR